MSQSMASIINTTSVVTVTSGGTVILAGTVELRGLKSGVNQGAAGANEYEIWIDTADNTIKVGT